MRLDRFVRDYPFKLIYTFLNNASLSQLMASSQLTKSGAVNLRLDSSALEETNSILSKAIERASKIVPMFTSSCFDLSNVGSPPLSIESLCNREEIQKLTSVAKKLLIQNPVIHEYLGLPPEQLTLKLDFLCNTETSSQPSGSQNFHRDSYHCFYRGLKIFYPFSYQASESYGPFRYIPLTSMSSSQRPSYIRTRQFSEFRFSTHPAIKSREKEAQTLQPLTLTAIDTYNTIHTGGWITERKFIRLVFQISILPPFNPEHLNDISSSHMRRAFYFWLCKLHNKMRAPVST